MTTVEMSQGNMQIFSSSDVGTQNKFTQTYIFLRILLARVATVAANTLGILTARALRDASSPSHSIPITAMFSSPKNPKATTIIAKGKNIVN